MGRTLPLAGKLRVSAPSSEADMVVRRSKRRVPAISCRLGPAKGSITLVPKFEKGKTMSIADLGSIGEFVGSFAVLLTLGYLAIQARATRQATDLQTMMALNSMSSTIIAGMLTTKSDALEIFFRGNGGEPLNDGDLNVFAVIYSALVVTPVASILHAVPSPTRTRTLSGFEKLLQAGWRNPNFTALWNAGFWSTLPEDSRKAIENYRHLD
jgi:hypothetical protein